MADEKFELVSSYQPTGDQPQAIETLVKGVERGDRCQTLLGVTGSGKTFTMANVIAKCNRPTLVLAHNKTLAAQLCTEFRSFFPNNAVEYFVSYYDYYQPEAYIPHTDTYIAKDASTNDEIDRLRLSATCALLERRDVIVVSSVSCIYGLGEPDDFAQMVISLRQGAEWDRDELLRRLVEAAGPELEILVGAGVTPENLPALAAATGARAFHLSGKRVLDSRMTFRREGVPMGLPGFSEFALWQTDAGVIRRARSALDSL
mgnify:CR=1 FL=1